MTGLAALAERVRTNVLVRQSALVFAATMVLNVGGFLFHAIASRRLGPDDYGTLYALISACTIATLPSAVITPVIIRFAAEFRALHDASHVRTLARDVARIFGWAGIAYVVVASIASVPIAGFLKFPVWSIPLMAMLAASMLVGGALRGVIQGTQQFGDLAASTVAEGIVKVLALVAFMLLGLALVGGIGGFLIGSLAGVAVLAWRLIATYAPFLPASIHYDWRRMVLSGAGAAATTIGTTLMSAGDTILVKHFFSAGDAGIYGAASLGGKVLLYLVGFAPTVLLPQATDRHVRGERTRGVIFGTLALIVVLGGLVLIGMRFFGVLLLHALVGHAYDAAALLLPWYAAAMIFFSMTTLLASYGIATHRLAFAVPLLACTLGTLGAIAAYHPSLMAVVAVFTIGNAVTAAGMAIALGLQAIIGLKRLSS